MLNIETALSEASVASWAHPGKCKKNSAGMPDAVHKPLQHPPTNDHHEGMWLAPETMLMMQQLQLANELRDLRRTQLPTSAGIPFNACENETDTPRQQDYHGMLKIAELQDLIQLASIKCDVQESAQLCDLIRFESGGFVSVESKADIPDLIQLDSVDGVVPRMPEMQHLHLLDSSVDTPALKCVFSVDFPVGEFLWPVQVDAAATEGSGQPAEPESTFLDSLNCKSEAEFTASICEDYSDVADQVTFSPIVAIETEESPTEDRSYIYAASGKDASAPSLPAGKASEADAALEADAVLVDETSGKNASSPSLPADKANEADAILETDAVLLKADAVLQDDAGMQDDSVLKADTGNLPVSVQPEAVITEAAIDSGSPLRLYRQDLESTEPEKSAPSHMLPLQIAACEQVRQESAGVRFMRAIQQTLDAVRQAMAPGKMPACGSLGMPLPSTSTGVAEMVSLMAAEADH